MPALDNWAVRLRRDAASARTPAAAATSKQPMTKSAATGEQRAAAAPRGHRAGSPGRGEQDGERRRPHQGSKRLDTTHPQAERSTREAPRRDGGDLRDGDLADPTHDDEERTHQYLCGSDLSHRRQTDEDAQRHHTQLAGRTDQEILDEVPTTEVAMVAEPGTTARSRGGTRHCMKPDEGRQRRRAAERQEEGRHARWSVDQDDQRRDLQHAPDEVVDESGAPWAAAKKAKR